MIQLKDVIQYYIGQRFMYSSHHEPQNQTYVLHASMMDETLEFGDKPVLRRLEDMTEDEIFKMCQLHSDLYHDIDNCEFVGMQFYFTHRYRVNKKRYQKNFSIKQLNYGQFHYLLKQGFDLFSLIDNGFAVDQKTLNQKV